MGKRERVRERERERERESERERERERESERELDYVFTISVSYVDRRRIVLNDEYPQVPGLETKINYLISYTVELTYNGKGKEAGGGMELVLNKT